MLFFKKGLGTSHINQKRKYWSDNRYVRICLEVTE